MFNISLLLITSVCLHASMALCAMYHRGNTFQQVRYISVLDKRLLLGIATFSCLLSVLDNMLLRWVRFHDVLTLHLEEKLITLQNKFGTFLCL